MAQTLRFCSWNIQVGMRRRALLDIIKNYPDFQNLDVLALQEASAHEHGDDASSIAHLLGESYRSYHHIYHRVKTRPQANALVWNSTRVQFDSIEHHILPNLTEAQIPRAERAVLNRLKPQPRVNLIGSGSWNSVTLRVCAAHLDVMGYRFKRQQFRAVLDDLRVRPATEITILAGDFNTFRIGGRPTWAQLKRDAAELGLRAVTDKIQWTQAIRSIRLRQKLDEIFVTSARPYRARVWTLDVYGSDHLPVFADLEL
ncbi:MAG TPA: endonuclease/exonuclease/phosphatase family protein [Anaerolineae bacterium]|nr:endonuclease/exonuclease/phosphatase family protein [Anaerolineae bacterium]